MITATISGQDYFQQHVAYDISVELDDRAHTLSAYEKLTYTNNSPDTLEFIWFHLWPNAYKNDSTALAQQFLRLGSTRFKYTKEKDRGYIDSLDFLVDGVDAEWNFHKDWIDVVKVILPKPLIPGRNIIIETPFFVKLPKVISRLGHTGKHYEITQWYPKPAVYDKDGWHPLPYLNMFEFYSEFGLFDVRITLPKHYRIMATGDLINSEEELAWLDSLAGVGDSLKRLNDKDFKKVIKKLKKERKKNTKKDKSDTETDIIPVLKTVHFRQDRVHDFAWFADQYWIVNKGELWLKDSTRQVTLWSMYLPKNAEMWRSSVEYLHDSGYWYSRFYGNYPYNHITAVDGDMSAGGGMEYPNITVISRDRSKDLLEYVIMHEVGHNWFYGILGNNERDHTWLDEGLNEYSNIRYWEKKYSDRNNQFVMQDIIQNKLGVGKNFDIHLFHYLSIAAIAKSRDAQPLDISANESFAYANYGQNYTRTAVMMRFLEHYLGEQKIDQIMQDFYDTWKFRHPRPDDLRYSFEKHLDEDISWFFENVFENTSYIDFSITKKGNIFSLTNSGTFNVPVEVGYYDKSGKEIKRSWVRTDKKTMTLEAPTNATSATIDPDQLMPDVERHNNSTSRGIKTHFIFDKPSYYDRDIFIVPWLFSYNTYNGFTPGLYVWEGFMPGYGKTSLGLNLMYDSKNNKPVGSLLALIKGSDQFSIFFPSVYRIKIGTMAGRRGLQLGFSGTIKKPLTKSPVTKINADLYYHHLNGNALDPDLYDPGDHNIVSLRFEKSWYPSIFKDYYVSVGLKMGDGFIKSSMNSRFTFRMAEKIKTSLSSEAGSFFLSENIPRQYRYYLSGTVDPEFEQLVIDRTGSSSNLKVLYNTYHGSGVRGIVLEDPLLSTDDMFWYVKIDQFLPILPGNLFFDIAGSPDFEEPQYVSAGFVLGPIIIPIYQSWETGSRVPNSFEWIKNRFRIALVFPNITIGR